MNNKSISKMEAPLKLTKDEFVKAVDDNIVTQQLHPSPKQRTQVVNFTLYQSDLTRIEKQIDRATQLNMRNKNRSAIIRMALVALEQCSDEQYQKLYELN
jgi:hypothetical protein